MEFGISKSPQSAYLCPGKPARPAPAELPQDRKVARVGGCSGAMFGLPFFTAEARRRKVGADQKNILPIFLTPSPLLVFARDERGNNNKPQGKSGVPTGLFLFGTLPLHYSKFLLQ